MISIGDILEVHRFSLFHYGGGDGIRDLGLLESAINRPFQTFDMKSLYASIFEKLPRWLKV